MTSEAREHLEQVARDHRTAIKSGAAPTPHKLSVRRLLDLFGHARRGRLVVAAIRNALEENGLRTNPDFESVWIDHEILIELDRDSANGPPAALAFDDPTVRIDALAAAHRRPEVVDPDKPLHDATTAMLLNDYSQLPVTKNHRKIRGMITWKSIGSRLASGAQCRLVRDCLNPHVQEVRLGTPLLNAVAGIARHGYTLVRDSTDEIVGIVTTNDLSQEFHELASPFLLIGEIEKYLHTLAHGRFTKEEIQEALPQGLTATGTADLTLGGYCRLLQNPTNWAKLGLEFSGKLFVKRLEAVRETRNDVMHFRPDGLEPERLEVLQGLVAFFRHLAQMGVVETSTNSN